jgi:hypothetical protein
MLSDENVPGAFKRVPGSIGAEIWIKKGGAAPAGTQDCVFHGVTAHGRVSIPFIEADRGVTVHYLARWVGRNVNQVAPLSEPVSSMVVG